MLFLNNLLYFKFLLPLVVFSLVIVNFGVKVYLPKFLNNNYELLKVKIFTVRRYLFERSNDLLLLDYLSGFTIFHLYWSKAEILQECTQTVNSQMHFLVLQSIECHVLSRFENMSAIVLKDELDMVNSLHWYELLLFTQLFV